MSIVNNIITPPKWVTVLMHLVSACVTCRCYPYHLLCMWEKSPTLNMACGAGINLIITCNTAQLVYSCTPYNYSKSKITHWILCVPRGLCCPCTDLEVYIVQPREISKYLAVLHYQLLVGNQLRQCILTPGAQDQYVIVQAEYLHPCVIGHFL